MFAGTHFVTQNVCISSTKADMIKIKRYVSEIDNIIIEDNIYCIGWKISSVWLPSQPPTPKFDIFLQYETYDFAHNITNISYSPAIFIFSIVLDVINEMQMLFAARTVSSYLPREQTLKIYVQEIRQKSV